MSWPTAALGYADLGAVHHFDLRAGDDIYRAFLLAGGAAARGNSAL